MASQRIGPPQIIDPPVKDVPAPPEAEAPAEFLLEQITFDGEIDEQRSMLAAYQTVCAAKGWKRLFLASALTGNPEDILMMWRVPGGYPPKQPTPDNIAGGDPKTLPLNIDFEERIARLDRTVLAALPYDPQERARPAPGDKLLVVKATVRDGYMPRLLSLKAQFFKPVVEDLGWKLFSAGRVASRTGPSSTILQCWHLLSMENLVTAMVAMAHSPTYTKELAPCILREDQQFYSVMDA